MRRSPRSVKIAFTHRGPTLHGGLLFFNDLTRVLQLRQFLTRESLDHPDAIWTIFSQFTRKNRWRAASVFSRIDRLLQASLGDILDFMALLRQTREIHAGYRSYRK